MGPGLRLAYQAEFGSKGFVKQAVVLFSCVGARGEVSTVTIQHHGSARVSTVTTIPTHRAMSTPANKKSAILGPSGFTLHLLH